MMEGTDIPGVGDRTARDHERRHLRRAVLAIVAGVATMFAGLMLGLVFTMTRPLPDRVVRVPNVLNLTVPQARSVLAAAGLSLGVVTGSRQDPIDGQSVAPSTIVSAHTKVSIETGQGS
jgi:hypothetical protein